MKILILKKKKYLYYRNKNHNFLPTYNKLDVKSKATKQKIALAIAKFYVKVAHIFAAIASTIDPEYSFKDEKGEETFNLRSLNDLTQTINIFCSKSKDKKFK